MIRLVGVKKYFPVTRGLLFQKVTGWIKAVDGVNLSVGEGKTLSLIGESGCGKSTTARLILLLERPTEGDILFDGKSVQDFGGSKLREYRRAVQAVFQDPFSSLSPRMKVDSIIAEPLEANTTLSRGERTTRVEDLLVQVGLDPSDSKRYPHEFSGGQRQRIALARALATSPRLIVLDEPVSALDVSMRAQIMNLLGDIQENLGCVYLLIVHNLAVARHMSSKTAVMYLGKIVEEADTEELFLAPLHPYTQALLQSALPSHPDEKVEDIGLSGEVPSPLNPLPGCRFHPRCRHAMAVCQKEEPPLHHVGSEHEVACHLISL